MKALKNCQTAMKRNRYGGNVERIPAKVPILRFRKDGIQVDVNCNNLTGLRNTWLLHSYSGDKKGKIRDTRVKPLAMFIKKIAKTCNINDSSQGTLTRKG